MLRCVDGPDGATVVEVEVASAGTGGHVSRGPYRFRTAHEAFQFVQEATLALQYLGCTVGSL
jgi:hypothetical protein